MSPGPAQSRASEVVFTMLMALALLLAVLAWSQPEAHVVDDLLDPHTAINR